MNLATALNTLVPVEPRYPDCMRVPPVSVDLEATQYPTSNPSAWQRRLVQEGLFKALKLTGRTCIARRPLVRLVDILPIGTCK